MGYRLALEMLILVGDDVGDRILLRQNDAFCLKVLPRPSLGTHTTPFFALRPSDVGL